jgi:transcriptional regulator with AAA-type ATPase domain
MNVDGDSTCKKRSDDAAPLTLLVVGDSTVQSIALPPRGAVVIGRARDCDVPIGDPSVSRQHARLHVAPLRLEDLGSANGTRVGARHVGRGEGIDLVPGDAFTLGAVTLFVQRARSQASGIEVRTDAYFDARLVAECARAQKYALRFALVTLAVERGSTSLEAAVRAEARPGDIVGPGPRGEVRALLLHATRELAEAFATRVCGRLSEPTDCEIGIALCPEDAIDPGGLLASARVRASSRALRGREDGSLPAAADDASRAVLERVVRLAASELPVLFTGEEGTGKRTFAAWLHQQSRRARRPLVRVTCQAVSEAQLEGELFGIESGPDAREGALEIADGGTLLIDHVDELPAAFESRLMHVLEYGQVYRAGSITPRRARVRFLATARRRPEGRDIVRRLAGAVVEVPPLRARPADIEPLARRFATTSTLRAKNEGIAFAPDALDALRAYEWPGNVGELRLTVERAIVSANDGRIQVSDLDLPASVPPSGLALHADVERLERDRIESALAASGGNRSRAARALGIARNTLLARLKAYGL